MMLGANEYKLRILLNILQCTGQTPVPHTENYLVKTSIVLMLRTLLPHTPYICIINTFLDLTAEKKDCSSVLHPESNTHSFCPQNDISMVTVRCHMSLIKGREVGQCSEAIDKFPKPWGNFHGLKWDHAVNILTHWSHIEVTVLERWALGMSMADI